MSEVRVKSGDVVDRRIRWICVVEAEKSTVEVPGPCGGEPSGEVLIKKATRLPRGK